ncbi:MAG: major tail protein [Huintestinicola sp.]
MGVSYGLSKLYYAVISDNGYGTPKHLPGAVKIDLTPITRDIKFTGLDGEEKKPYTILDGYDGTIESAGLTDDFLVNILGYSRDTDGSLVEDGSVIALPNCAIMFETLGEKTRHRYYYCEFLRPSFSAETLSESVKVDTVTLSVRIRKHPTTKKIKRILKDTSADSYKTWFTAVV